VSYIWNDIFVVIVKRTGFILDHWIIFYVKYLCFAKRVVFVLDHYIGLFSPFPFQGNMIVTSSDLVKKLISGQIL
jgi:hypothetical protein